MADMLDELQAIDEHLKRQGSGVALVIQHCAVQLLGQSALPPDQWPAEPAAEPGTETGSGSFLGE